MSGNPHEVALQAATLLLGSTPGLAINIERYGASALSLTTTYTDVSGLSTVAFTPSVNEYALVWVNAQFLMYGGTAPTSSGDVLGAVLDVYYSGTDHLESVRAGVTVWGGAGSTYAVMVYKVALTAGVTYTLKVQARNDTGNRGQISSNSHMVVWRMPR